MSTESAKNVFSIKDYKQLSEIPIAALDRLNYSAYLIDYNWVYLVINKNARDVFGELADELIGKSALDVFRDKKFAEVFDKIQYGVDKRIPVEASVRSPMRGKQVIIKGHPLEDCYFFAVNTLPDKFEILNEIRTFLKRK